jgi:hypothetical protein
MHHAAICMVASMNDRPVAFSAWLQMPHQIPNIRREHRTVCLPDYQGVGIGNLVSNTIASAWVALGYRAHSTTTHPSMIAARARSKDWMMLRAPSPQVKVHTGKKVQRVVAAFNKTLAVDRMTASFRYMGPPMDKDLALRLLQVPEYRR